MSSRPILVLCHQKTEATAVHYFSSMLCQCIDAAGLHSLSSFTKVSAVIFCRDLFPSLPWLAAVRKEGIPHYYFVDENIVSMNGKPQHSSSDDQRYGQQELQLELASFSGVLTASESLANYVREHDIHASVSCLPPGVKLLPVLPSSQILNSLPFKSPRVIRIACFSAQTQQSLFAQLVVPALRKLAHDFNIELIAFGCPPGSLDDPSSPLRVRTPELNMDHLQIMNAVSFWNPEIIVHPDLFTQNTPYIVPQMLIRAAQIGAALVASNVGPYAVAARQTSPPLVLANNTVQSWVESIRLLLASPAMRLRLAGEAANYVRSRWKSGENQNALEQLAQRHPPPESNVQGRRAEAIFAAFSLRNDAASAMLREKALAQTQQLKQNDRDIQELQAALADSRNQLAILGLNHMVTSV
jgi:hypothetical protein